MTRDEFESILEEAYIEGYNTAIEDIQEDILDEEAFDLEGDYDYYTEDAHPRSLRGTGIHNLVKGGLGALRKTQRDHKKAKDLHNKYLNAIIGDDSNRISARKKSYKANREANKSLTKYNNLVHSSPEVDEQINRHVYGPSYKNSIKRIIDNRWLHAGDDKIMGKKNFLNKIPKR